MQVDDQTLRIGLVGPQVDAVDKRADDLRRLGLLVRVVQRLGQGGDPLAVKLRHVRVQEGRGLFGRGQQVLQLVLPVADGDQLIVDHLRRCAVGDGVDQLLDAPVDPLQLRLVSRQRGVVLHADGVHVFRELFGEDLVKGRVHQMILEAREDGLFHPVAADGAQVRTRALVSRRGTAEMLGTDLDEAAPAFPALHESREQRLRSPPGPQIIYGRGFCAEAGLLLARFHAVPKVLIDDPHFRDVLKNPVAFRIQARDALARRRVLDIAQAVPDQTADIKLVVQDAGAALAVAADGAEAPGLPGGAGNAVLVQVHGNRARGSPGSVFLEDAPHDAGLVFVDGALAPDRLAFGVERFDHVVAVGQATAGLSGFDAPAQAPAGLVGQVLEVQRAHRALEADV